MNNTFHPGQLVECIDDVLRDNHGTLDGLTKGHVYRVRWAGCMGRKKLAGIRLHEITDREPDVPYYADRFRPVDDDRLAVFRKAFVRKTEAA